MMLPAKRVFLGRVAGGVVDGGAVRRRPGPSSAGALPGSPQWKGPVSPAVGANGVATVQRNPARLRLYMQLQAKGKTLEEALSKLKELREAATVQLETLKADKKSVVFGSPGASNRVSARRRQIEAMVAQQMRSRGKKCAEGAADPADGRLGGHAHRRMAAHADSTRNCC